MNNEQVFYIALYRRRTRHKLGIKPRPGTGSHAIQMPKISRILAPTRFPHHRAALSETTNGGIYALTCCEDGAISSNLLILSLISWPLRMEAYKAGHNIQTF